MSTGKIVIAANWKMNKDLLAVEEFVEGLDADKFPSGVEVIIACPFPFLSILQDFIRELGLPVSIAAQNCHHEEKGAFTGEVSAMMLSSLGVDWVILGHSERRKYFGEDDLLLRKKISQVQSHEMGVIWCCGESLEERNQNKQRDVVGSQIESSLLENIGIDWSKLIIAYEPIWAIGTGEVATPEQAQDMHDFIKSKLPENVRSFVPIIYGGSMKPNNANELLAKPDVHGGLVGGASLEPQSFQELIEIGSQYA